MHPTRKNAPSRSSFFLKSKTYKKTFFGVIQLKTEDQNNIIHISIYMTFMILLPIIGCKRDDVLNKHTNKSKEVKLIRRL